MIPIIEIYNIKIPTYDLLCGVGLIITLMFSLYLAKYQEIKKEYIFYSFIYEMIGFLLGAKLYYIGSHINSFLIDIGALSSEEMLKLFLPGFSFIGAFIRRDAWNKIIFSTVLI